LLLLLLFLCRRAVRAVCPPNNGNDESKSKSKSKSKRRTAKGLTAENEKENEKDKGATTAGRCGHSARYGIPY